MTKNTNIYRGKVRIAFKKGKNILKTTTHNNGVWMSILNSPVNIGGRQYKFDPELNNWLGILISTIYYSDLNGGILDKVLDQAESGYIDLKVRLCSYDERDRKYFAEIVELFTKIFTKVNKNDIIKVQYK